MMQNMVHPQDQQFSIDEITSPLGAHQIFDFCDSDLLHETLQNSEVASSSNGCYDEQSSYPTQLSNITADQMNKYTTTAAAAETDQIKQPPPSATAAGAPIFDDPATQDQIENTDISASIDFTPSPSFSAPHHPYNLNVTTPTTSNNGGGCSSNNNNQEPFNMSSLNQLSLGDMVNGPLHHTTTHQYGNAPERWAPPPPVVPILGPPPPPPPIPAGYEDECLPSVPPYIRLRSSQPAAACSLMDPMMSPYLPSASMNAPPFSAENSGIFGGSGLMLGNDISHHQELDFQGDNSRFFLPDNVTRVFNCSGDLQALSSESQHLVHGGANSTPLASEISSLEDPTFKVGKLSVEERKRKIHRYMKKRNERNFSKKIKYACRKTLADSRPRVRGRFAKNDELGELARTNGSNHEDEEDEDVSLFSNSMPDHQRKGVKDEDDMDSSDIFAHISGVNSFKCNYPIQSWI